MYEMKRLDFKKDRRWMMERYVKKATQRGYDSYRRVAL